MDRVKKYGEIVKRLLRDREAIARPSLPEGMDVTCLFDDGSGQYALMSVGWMQGERICGATLFLRVRDGRIWVEEDETDAPIADELVEAGVPRRSIMLGFQAPDLRVLTEFAAG